MGSFAQVLALTWVVLRENGGALHLGFVVAIATLPWTLLALEGGVLADRYAPRAFVVVMQLLLAANASVLAILEGIGNLSLWEISAAAAISGTLGTLVAPGSMRLVHDIVDEDELPAAIALSSVEFNVARVAGPALGGLLLAAGGPGVCFGGNAASFLVFALVVSRISLQRNDPPAQRPTLRHGLRAVRAVPPLVTVALVLGPIGLLGLNLSAFGPIVADTVLRFGAAGFGLVTSAAGVGSVLAGVVLTARNRVGLKSYLLGAFTLSGGLILVAASTETAVVLTGFFVFGIGTTTALASATTLFQRLAPAEAEGTGLGVYNLLVIGTTPVGSVLVGALASTSSIRVALAVFGVGCIAAAATGVVVARRRRQLTVEVCRGAVAQ
jgi:Transmembrane secretion effector